LRNNWSHVDVTGGNEGNEVMTSTEPGLANERDSGLDSQALRVLLVLEVLLQTTVFTILITLHVQPFVVIGICAILFIACRLAARACKSQLQQPTTH
jgi:hypothetical protein